ncbi:MAG: hypothetical protein ACRCX8_18820 [Sarcina sp.]
MDIKRRENESEFEYAKRIVYGKLVDKTIDLDYSELSGLIYEKGYSSDVARRIFYGLRDAFQLMDKENIGMINEDDTLAKIEEKELDLIKERKKLQATKLELNRKLTHEARFELFYETIKDTIEALPVPKLEAISNVKGKKGYIQAFTDVHYGASFKTQANEYSREICKNRFELMLGETIDYCKRESVSEMNVVNCSDNIQGMIHMSDIKINEVPVPIAIVEISRIIANYLNELSAHTKVVYHHVMASNHAQARYLGSKASELATEDMELLIANYIKDLLRDNDRVEVILSDSDYINLNVCGYEILGMHGHQVKNIKDVINKYSILHKKFYQYCILGHTHAGQTVTVGAGESGSMEVLVVPSMVGSCPYSARLGLDAKAMSKVYKFEEGYGLTQTNNIILN